MTVVAACLVPGSPLPYLRSDNPPWAALANASRALGRSLALARPDVLLVYSTQWLAVLDELWLTRPLLEGVHVDENWYEFGDLPYRMRVDVELAGAAIEGSKRIGISAKGVDYDAFPVDTGTIVANGTLNPDGRLPLVVAANNLYHSWEQTEALGAMAADAARRLGRKVAVVGVGGLSGSVFHNEIDIRNDHIVSAEDDRWNREILRLCEQGDVAGLRDACPRFVKEARADMGFKHMAWILGALGGRLHGARIHAYGTTYGSGAADVEFRV
jgi:2-aminophenol/2-amino-5-chlorophenol 1,6-dioxygenase alpha subunit